MLARGYAEPELDVEVRDPLSARLLGVAEAYWPNGLQEGIGQPVILELDPKEADEDGLADAFLQAVGPIGLSNS